MVTVSEMLFPFEGILVNLLYLYTVATVLSIFKIHFLKPGLKCDRKHAFITGGSTGLGLAIAKDFAKRGSHITIVSRSKSNLENAVKEIKRVIIHPDQKINSFSCDVTKFEQVQGATSKALDAAGPIDIAVSCAGLAFPGYFCEQNVDVFTKSMELNYYGAVHTAKACIQQMLEEGVEGGKFVIVSSGITFGAVCGYTQYAATKYALRGFSDSLRNEVQAYGIDVHIYFPSSIDTPGFKEECKTKPAEAAAIEGNVVLVSAESASAVLFQGIEKGFYNICNDILVEMGRIGNNGLGPRNYPLVEFALLPLLGPIMSIFAMYTDWVVTNSKSPQLRR